MEAHELGYFTEENSAEVVTGRNKNALGSPAQGSHGGPDPQTP
jgi:hypothetical protein